MADFNGILKEAIDGGESLESAMRKAASLAAKEAIESLLRTGIKAVPGYDRYDPSGKNSGDSRNGTYQRTVQTSLGPIVIDVPRDRNGEYKPIAIPRYQRRTDLITSTMLKLHSSGMTGEEMRLAISSIYEAHCSRSTVSSIADAVAGDVGRFAKRKLPKRLFAVFLDSAYVPLRRDTVAKEAINIALGTTDDGTPPFIGFPIAPSESAGAYGDLLAGFRSRGLEEAEVAVADGLQGIDGAISSSYPKARRRRCFVRLLRNVCSRARTSDGREVADAFMGIAKQEDAESGKKALGDFVAKRKGKYPKLGLWSEKAEHMLTFYEFPRELRALVYTNNRVESFDKQIKRMVKKQIRFVSEAALEKRIVSMALHCNEDIGKRKAKCRRSIVEYYEPK